MNQLFSASTNPTTIKSGGTVATMVTCTVENAGTMTITAGHGFEINRTARPLASGQTQDHFDLSITRKSATTKNCDLQFDFRGSRQTTTVTVEDATEATIE